MSNQQLAEATSTEDAWDAVRDLTITLRDPDAVLDIAIGSARSRHRHTLERECSWVLWAREANGRSVFVASDSFLLFDQSHRHAILAVMEEAYAELMDYMRKQSEDER